MLPFGDLPYFFKLLFGSSRTLVRLARLRCKSNMPFAVYGYKPRNLRQSVLNITNISAGPG